jgi:hypothetical protein
MFLLWNNLDTSVRYACELEYIDSNEQINNFSPLGS